jgi:hypothetical protein
MRGVKHSPLQRYRSTACSKNQENQGNEILEESLEDVKEKAGRLRQHLDYGNKCG